MPLLELAQQLAVAAVPKPGGAVAAGTQDFSAVRRERYAKYGIIVRVNDVGPQDQLLAVALQVPNLDVSIVSAGNQEALDERQVFVGVLSREGNHGDRAHTAGVPAQRLTKFPVLEVPQAHRVIVAGGHERFAVRGELQGVDRRRVTLQRGVERALGGSAFSIGNRLPEQHSAVITCAGDLIAIGRERGRVNRPGVPEEGKRRSKVAMNAVRFSFAIVPDHHGTILAGRHNAVLVGREGRRADPPLVAAEQAQLGARGCVPNPGGVIIGAAQKLPAVRRIDEAQNRVAMPGKRFFQFAGGGIINLDISWPGICAGRQMPAVRRKREGKYAVAARVDLQELPARGGVPNPRRSTPAGAGEASAILGKCQGLDGVDGVDRAAALCAKIAEATPFPVSQGRRTFLQKRQGAIEGVVVDFGRRQADAGDIRAVFFLLRGLVSLLFVLLRDLRLRFGDAALLNGHLLLGQSVGLGDVCLLFIYFSDLGLCLGNSALLNCHLLLSQSVGFGYIGLLLVLCGDFLFVLGHLLLSNRLFLLFEGVIFCSLGDIPLVVDQKEGDGDDCEDRNDQSHSHAAGRLKPAHSRAEFFFSVAKPLQERRVRFFLRVQQLGAKIEVAIVQRQPGIGQGRFFDALRGPRVAFPKSPAPLGSRTKHGHSIRIPARRSPAAGLPRAHRQGNALGVRTILTVCLLQVRDGGIAVVRVGGHRLQRNIDQLARLVRRLDHIPRGGHQAGGHRSAGVRSLAGDDFEENGSQEIDVAAEADPFHRPDGHLRRHVGGGARHARLRRRGRADRERQSPVHHQHFAEAAQHYVFGLQVAVNDAAGMGECDGVADLHPDFQILLHGLLANHLVPRRALDVLHRVEECARFVLPQIVDRYDVRVLQVARHGRFGNELLPRFGFDGLGRLDLLDGHDAVDRRLPSGHDHAHAAFAELGENLVVCLSAGQIGRLSNCARRDDAPLIFFHGSAAGLERGLGSCRRIDLSGPHHRDMADEIGRNTPAIDRRGDAAQIVLSQWRVRREGRRRAQCDCGFYASLAGAFGRGRRRRRLGDSNCGGPSGFISTRSITLRPRNLNRAGLKRLSRPVDDAGFFLVLGLLRRLARRFSHLPSLVSGAR